MSNPTEEAFKNRCVVCGELLPGATASTLITCGICGGTACPHCAMQMRIHHMRYEGVIHVCPKCSNQLNDKGNKPINPYQYLGGY